MAGCIGSVQKAADGQSYGFVFFDAQDRACISLGFSTWHDADRAAREAQGLLVTALACVRRYGATVPKPTDEAAKAFGGNNPADFGTTAFALGFAAPPATPRWRQSR